MEVGGTLRWPAFFTYLLAVHNPQECLHGKVPILFVNNQTAVYIRLDEAASEKHKKKKKYIHI